MPRPRKPRFVRSDVSASYFKPRGIPLRDLDEVTLGIDGLEALRLADAEGLDQATAAAQMGISRSTFSRLVAEARRTVATALVKGAAICIRGGPVAWPAAKTCGLCCCGDTQPSPISEPAASPDGPTFQGEDP